MFGREYLGELRDYILFFNMILIYVESRILILVKDTGHSIYKSQVYIRTRLVQDYTCLGISNI